MLLVMVWDPDWYPLYIHTTQVDLPRTRLPWLYPAS